MLVVLFSELLFPASVLELGVVLPVLPEVALRILCCPPACWLPSASVSLSFSWGTAAAFGVALAQFVGAYQLPVLPHLPRLNQTLCVHLLCSCSAPAPALVVFKC